MRRLAEVPEDLLSVDELKKLTGLEFMTGVMNGQIAAAPIANLLDYDLVEVEEGRVVFAGVPGFRSYNPIGSVHGGWFGTLLDSCMACAVHTALPVGQGYTTLEYKINVIRPATIKTGLLRAVGTTLHVGRRTGVASGRIVDEAGKLYATGSTTCMIFDL
ncbi:MAG: PaaI family thioesterase [Pikeienuella sp.]